MLLSLGRTLRLTKCQSLGGNVRTQSLNCWCSRRCSLGVFGLQQFPCTCSICAGGNPCEGECLTSFAIQPHPGKGYGSGDTLPCAALLRMTISRCGPDEWHVPKEHQNVLQTIGCKDAE